MTRAENPLQWRSLLLRLMVIGIVLALWFWSQALIGSRTAPASGIGDAVHNLTAGLNSYFSQNPGAANALLVVSSALIDALGVFLLARWFVERSVRPFLEAATVLILRAHYTFDVFTGIIAALWIAHISERLSPRLDRLLGA